MDLTVLSQSMAAAGAAGAASGLYVEDVFSTYLYTGTGSSQTITNGIDLAGEGGLVWVKNRTGAYNHYLATTPTGFGWLYSNTTDAVLGSGGSTFSFNSNGWTTTATGVGVNATSNNYVSWTFRKAPGFFDVVTWTGTDGGGDKTISHSLGAKPAVIIVRRYNGTDNWSVYHKDLFGGEIDGSGTGMYLNSTSAAFSMNNEVKTVTDSDFTVGTTHNGSSSYEYIAYLFAHNAGGFGADGTEDVISCGSYTGNGTSGQLVNLGWEPQFVLVKRSDSTGNWMMVDIMRGSRANGAYPCNNLHANTSESEQLYGSFGPDPLGFRISASTSTNSNGSPFIYIAIRRPMKTPTAGTEVFAIDTGSTPAIGFDSGFPVDASLYRDSTTTDNMDLGARLTGAVKMKTNLTDAETADGDWTWDRMNGWYAVAQNTTLYSWMFKRAPGFFDVVCDTGTGTAHTINHNLGVAPELLIRKRRSAPTENWLVLPAILGASELRLNQTNAIAGGSSWNNTLPTDTVFTVGSGSDVNGSGYTYVNYLFATLVGVSKVGSYTGTTSDINVDCGFSAGARFVLIKRTDSTGDWYVWDSARGIVAGNDPYLLLNSTAAEVTSTDYVDAYSAGFTVTSTAPAALNASGGTYIFLAIA